MKTKINKRYINKKTGAVSIVVDVKKATAKGGRFVYYIDANPEEFFSNYTMKLPETNFLKKYNESK